MTYPICNINLFSDNLKLLEPRSISIGHSYLSIGCGPSFTLTLPVKLILYHRLEHSGNPLHDPSQTMNDNVTHTGNSRYRLEFSQPFFVDYLTAVIAQIRQDTDTDNVYSGVTPHPLIGLQTSNQRQIQNLRIQLVAPAVLQFHPFVPTEKFIKLVNEKSNQTPKLDGCLPCRLDKI